jgi:hypothetical protein
MLAALATCALTLVHCGTSPVQTAPIGESIAALDNSPAPAHLKYFGYFFVDVEQDDPHDAVDKKNFTDEVAGFSNIAQMTAYYPTQDLRTRIQLMNAKCIKPFISLQELFYTQSRPPGATRTTFTLVSNYREQWQTFKTVNGPMLSAASVGAFYLADEPVWNNLSFEDLDTVSKLVKADYPDVPNMIVEAFPVLDQLRVPTTVDWVGFDRYMVFKPSADASFLAQVKTMKSKRSRPDQKLFLTIDDRWEPQYGAAGVTPAKMSDTILDYYELAASDPDISGLLGFLWAGTNGDPNELGVRDMPQNIIDLNQQIGKKVVANYSMCAPAKPPDAGTAPASIGDTGAPANPPQVGVATDGGAVTGFTPGEAAPSSGCAVSAFGANTPGTALAACAALSWVLVRRRRRVANG